MNDLYGWFTILAIYFLGAPSNSLAQRFRNSVSAILNLKIIRMKNGRNRHLHWSQHVA